MVRWNSDKEGEILASLFELGMADPDFSKPSEIDPIKETKEEFREFSVDNFRKNYKKTAASWFAAKHLKGIRRKDCEFIGVYPFGSRSVFNKTLTLLLLLLSLSSSS